MKCCATDSERERERDGKWQAMLKEQGEGRLSDILFDIRVGVCGYKQDVSKKPRKQQDFRKRCL